MHFLYKLSVVLCSLLSLHGFIPLLVLLILQLCLLLEDTASELTLEPLLVHSSFHPYLIHMLLSLISQLLRQLSLLFFIDFLMSEDLVSINRPVELSLLL
jgi:hypothetical protein